MGVSYTIVYVFELGMYHPYTPKLKKKEKIFR